ncbi:hypothetical protein LOK49_LG13G00177 [Camellia lanceoleosa]|uniref:Uncharacterized protein n=1 Tax=Camellia lanceoleosa TaxID=1840588 RepID=A0ACC0FF36_9ERIC|nr:hypothetical protein LOK49_LG13G00177 [Camellia lanceoleosa]
MDFKHKGTGFKYKQKAQTPNDRNMGPQTMADSAIDLLREEILRGKRVDQGNVTRKEAMTTAITATAEATEQNNLHTLPQSSQSLTSREQGELNKNPRINKKPPDKSKVERRRNTNRVRGYGESSDEPNLSHDITPPSDAVPRTKERSISPRCSRMVDRRSETQDQTVVAIRSQPKSALGDHELETLHGGQPH